MNQFFVKCMYKMNFPIIITSSIIVLGIVILIFAILLLNIRSNDKDDKPNEKSNDIQESIVEGMENVNNMMDDISKCNSCTNIPLNNETNQPSSIINEDHAKTEIIYKNPSCMDIVNDDADFTNYMMGFDKVKKVVDMQAYNYNIDGPGYYLMANGQFSAEGVSPDKIVGIMNDSKLHGLYNQHNFRYKWSPHTHIGKSRGYMNWSKI